MSARKLVVFDVDGTLIDSQDHILAAMAAGFAGAGHPLPPREAILSIVGLSLPQAVARLVPDLSKDDQVRITDGHKSAFGTLRAQSHSPLFPGASVALADLAARPDVRLGIATGKSRRGLTHVLAAHGLSGAFATTQVADDHPSKPDPAMLHAALAETGTAPERAVMIGDTVFDIEMARAAGVAAIGVGWGYHPAANLAAAGAAAVIGTFAELGVALDGLWGTA